MNCPHCHGTNPSGMLFCGHCGQPVDGAHGVRERRRVSIVFVDLVGFSDLVRDRAPEHARELADRVLSAVSNEVEALDGYVESFRGDGVVALFGAPRAHPDDAERAVRAASESLRTIEAIGHERGFPLAGRAGVNTGTVIAGPMGTGRVQGYTVMGSSVNLASRLEAAAGPNEVWVGLDTYRETRHRLEYEPTGPLEVPGFPDVKRAYRLLPTDVPRSLDPFDHLRFVGREDAVAALRYERDRVLYERRPRVAWVVGDTGSGKTRTVREALENGVPETERGRVVWVRPQPSTEAPWWQLADAMFELNGAGHAAATESQLDSVLASLLPDEPRWRGAILESLSLRDARQWRRVDRRTTAREVLAWSDLITAQARSDARVWTLVLDDTAYDGPMAELFRRLSDIDAPILLIRTSRDRRPPHSARTIRLGPLSSGDANDLVKQLIVPPLSSVAISLIPHLGGVPAHLIELARALSLQEEAPVAASLASLLQARLDRLPARTRTLLAHASLAGEHVWDGLLEALASGRPHEDVAEAPGTSPVVRSIDLLIAEAVLVSQPVSSIPNQRQFRFQSELLRRAVTQMVPFDERPAVQVRIATWLERFAALDFSERIAALFSDGRAFDAAHAHWMVAAEQATLAGDPARADSIYERLTVLPVSPGLRAQAALSWAQSAIDRHDVPTAQRALGVATDALDAPDEEDHPHLRSVLHGLAADLSELPSEWGDAASRTDTAHEDTPDGGGPDCDRPGGERSSGDGSGGDASDDA